LPRIGYGEARAATDDPNRGNDTVAAANVQFHCSCGELVTWDEETVTRSTLLSCAACGQEIGTYGDVEDEAVRAVRDCVVRFFREGE
jgi:hypothetical protein